MQTQRPAPSGAVFNGHLSGRRLWLYCLNRMNELDRGQVEEHLLVCEDCRGRLDLAEMLASVDPPDSCVLLSRHMPAAQIESAHTVAVAIAAMLRANGVHDPATLTRDLPCSLEYLIENALRKLGGELGRDRLRVDCGGAPFPKFIYPAS